MTTPFNTVYESFLSKIEDYEILKEINTNITFVNELLYDFLKSAIPKFTYSTKDLSLRDDTLQEFSIDLSEIEIEILAILMVVEYLSPKIIRSENLEQYLGSKDLRQYSPANQLKESRELRESVKREANLLMVEYYYREGY